VTAPLAAIILGLAFLGSVLWLLLDRHEGRRAKRGLARHGRGRLAVAAAAMLAALFTAMTGLLAFVSVSHLGIAAAVFVLPPIIGGVLVWHLAMRRKTG